MDLLDTLLQNYDNIETEEDYNYFLTLRLLLNRGEFFL